MIVAFVEYAGILATSSTVVTLQGMQGGLYNGVGRGTGSLIGGVLIHKIGIKMTFRTMAVISGIAGVCYFFVNAILDHCGKQKSEDSKSNNNDSPTTTSPVAVV